MVYRYLSRPRQKHIQSMYPAFYNWTKMRAQGYPFPIELSAYLKFLTIQSCWFIIDAPCFFLIAQ